jgi:hypothetical protein
MTTEEKIERLTGIVGTLGSSVVAHDNQIDALIRVAEKHEKEMADLIREWQAYLRRLPA